MHRGTLQRRLNYQRTLLAVYRLADQEGLLCHATWAELAAETGLYADTVKTHVRELERRGVVRLAPVRTRRARRTLVLMDHERAWEYLDGLTGTVPGSSLPLLDRPGFGA